MEPSIEKREIAVSRVTTFVMYLIAVVLLWSAALWAEPCSQLDINTRAEQLVSFLQGVRQREAENRNAVCIVFALNRLKYRPSTAASGVLVQLLDFHRPLTEPEKNGFFIHSPNDIARNFPAVATLFTFGEVAVIPLVEAIKNSDSAIVRQNAAYTLIGIFRDSPDRAIELLHKEATTTQGLQSQRLRAATMEGLRWCAPRKRPQCEAAAEKGASE